MSSLAPWARFVSWQARQRPLAFLHGMHHAVGKTFHCGFHSHEGIEIVYHPVGRGLTRLPDGQSLAFGEGSVVVYAPNQAHDQTMEKGGEDYCVQIAPPIPPSRLPRTHFHLPVLDDPATGDDIRLLARSHAGTTAAERAAHDFRATAVLLSLVNRACAFSRRDAASSAERHVLQAEQYVRDHLATLRSLPEIAAQLGISHDRLRHLYRSLRNRSLIGHVTEVRIDRAKALLVHSRLPMKQIASLCGFKDEYYFSAVFRKVVHQAPGRYRELHERSRLRRALATPSP